MFTIFPLTICQSKDSSLFESAKMPLMDDKIVFYPFVSESLVTSCGSMLADPSVLKYQKRSFHRCWIATLMAIHQHTTIERHRFPKCHLQEL